MPPFQTTGNSAKLPLQGKAPSGLTGRLETSIEARSLPSLIVTLFVALTTIVIRQCQPTPQSSWGKTDSAAVSTGDSDVRTPMAQNLPMRESANTQQLSGGSAQPKNAIVRKFEPQGISHAIPGRNICRIRMSHSDFCVLLAVDAMRLPRQHTKTYFQVIPWRVPALRPRR